MYKISRFSKQTKLSPRMLRHYDSIGLLQPMHVDGVTGYRYYADSQFQDAMEIIRLKRYGFSLEQIKQILGNHDPDQFRNLLQNQIQSFDKHLRERSSVIDEMEQLLGEDEAIFNKLSRNETYGIYTGIEPERHVIRKRAVMTEKDMDRSAERLYEEAKSRGLFPYNLAGAVFHDQDHKGDAVDVEVFVPVRESAERNEKSQEGNGSDHQVAVIPAHRVVTTLHTGRYDEIGFAWHEIEKWIDQSDYHQSGSTYEVYLRSSESAVPEHDYITRVCYPVEKTV